MRKVALVFCVTCCLFAKAQDSVAFHGTLDTISIQEPIKVHLVHGGTRTDYCDSTIKRLYPAGSLADLLGGGGVINLKSYGPGALSTMAMRLTHTASCCLRTATARATA